MFKEKEVIDSFMTSVSYKAQVGVRKLDSFFKKKDDNKDKNGKSSEEKEENEEEE